MDAKTAESDEQRNGRKQDAVGITVQLGNDPDSRRHFNDTAENTFSDSDRFPRCEQFCKKSENSEMMQSGNENLKQDD